MLEEWDDFARDLWERSKTPLERMYDRWVGEGNWEPARPRTSYIVYSHSDIVWRDIPVLADQPFPCHLCGAIDRWTIEGDEATRMARVFVCEHEPISLGRAGVRQISTVPVHLVSMVEESYSFSG
jgi:hypothetical protein